MIPGSVAQVEGLRGNSTLKPEERPCEYVASGLGIYEYSMYRNAYIYRERERQRERERESVRGYVFVRAL